MKIAEISEMCGFQSQFHFSRCFKNTYGASPRDMRKRLLAGGDKPLSKVVGMRRMTQIVSILDSYTYKPTIGQLVIQRLVTPLMGGTPDEAAIAAALPEVGNCMNSLERLLGDQKFLTGDTMSLADLHLAPIFGYFAATPESGAILEDKPGLHRWWESMKTRESMTKTEPKLG